MYRIAIAVAAAALVVAVAVVIVQQTGGEDDPAPLTARRRDERPPCPDPIGQPTMDVVDRHGSLDAGCVYPDGNSAYTVASYECTDGRTLHFDATGWGYSDGVWQAHTRTDGTTNPPDAEERACLG